jgi:non-specific serine/threonine protein kinase
MRSPPRALVAVVAGELADLAPAERQARLAALDRDDPTLARAVRARLAGGPAVADDESPAPGDMPAGVVATGARVGPYRVLRRIGRGGMATVWLAHDDRLDRPVALKVLNDAGEDDPAGEARGRFLVEARAAAGLDHPHVAGVHDVGETPDGRLYIAMAYCEGGSLADRLAAGPLPADDARRVTRQLAAALGAAHARGIVHRDVKPANVLLDAAGSVRLADFGIAKLPGVDATRPGFLVGTLAYLAPEQLRGERVDHRADLWALGVTLHEMLAGRRPFAGASHAAIMRAVLDAPPDPLPAGAAPAPLAALVARLLEKDPAARPQSADEVLAALDGVGPQDSGRTTHAPPGAPPAATAPAPPPAALTPLVGRERELALAVTLLARARLVTLTGPGGTGKTRLALEVARRAEPRHADGVYVVPLAAVPAPELVASAVAQATGLQEIGSLRPDEQALRYFARRQALLVLDNFEHLADAAPFVAALLAGAPRLTILVTSRAPLHVHGEHELPVPPLGLPDPGAATARAAGDAEAVRLFVQRAAAGRPDFALTDANAADVAAICRRLDGLPLAIELAAARVKLLAPRAILARLAQRLDLLRSDARDVAPRHRTLRDVIDWSYGLLAPEEQALFRELSVFVGGFTLDSAAAVAGAAGGGDAVDVLDRVASLADKSLLVRREQPDGEPRFHMLETVREYALARLEEGGDAAAARAAHRAHFLALAEEAASHLRGPTQVAWLERLDREHDNLRAALVDAQAADDVGAAARLGVALHRYWVITRRHLGDAVAHLAAIDARTRAGDRVPARTRALLLGALGLLTGVRSEFATSRRYFEESMRAYRDAGDAAGAATALNHLGWLSFLLGDLGPAESLSRRRSTSTRRTATASASRSRG